MLVDATLWLTLLASFMTIVLGLIHVGSKLGENCNSEVRSCVGPLLRWNDDGDFTADSNALWRSVFTFQPDLLALNWSPVLFGFLGVAVHVAPKLRWNMICSSWMRVCLWSLFLAIFCNFGYAGGLGIIVGFLSSLCAFLALVISFQFHDAPTSLGIQLTSVRRYDSGGMDTVGVIALVFSTSAAALTLAVGVVNIIDRLPAPCDPALASCVGPGLFWSIEGTSFTADINIIWKRFFTLAPSIFIDNFTPLAIGLVSVLIHLTSQFAFLASSWSRVCVWNLIQGLLVAGYGGNLGIIAMFVSSFASFLAFALSLSSSPPSRTRLDFDLFSHVEGLSNRRAYNGGGGGAVRTRKDDADNVTTSSVSAHGGERGTASRRPTNFSSYVASESRLGQAAGNAHPVSLNPRNEAQVGSFGPRSGR